MIQLQGKQLVCLQDMLEVKMEPCDSDTALDFTPRGETPLGRALDNPPVLPRPAVDAASALCTADVSFFFVYC